MIKEQKRYGGILLENAYSNFDFNPIKLKI